MPSAFPERGQGFVEEQEGSLFLRDERREKRRA